MWLFVHRQVDTQNTTLDNLELFSQSGFGPLQLRIKYCLCFAGLYVADVSKSSPVHTVAVTQAHEAPTLCLAWNTGSTGQTYLYANNGATVSVYRASQYDVPSV